MWITKQRAQQGPVFGSVDNFEGLGIFFDTYKNNRPGTVFPLVMAMVGDGKTSYNKDTDGREQELASCSVRAPSLLTQAMPSNATPTTDSVANHRHAASAVPTSRPRRA